MLDKKGKLFGKVSIVDIFVVLIILVMLAGSYVVYQKVSNKTVLTENKGLVSSGVQDSLEVTMRLKEVRQMTMDALSVGDVVYMEETHKYLGKITEIAQTPATRLIYSLDGTSVMAEVPERFDVLLKVNVPGSRLEDGFYTANNIQLVYGSSMGIITPMIQTTTKIESITLKPGA